MRIDIRYNDGSLVINLDNAGECKTHLFTLDDDINLTSLVQDVSESESMLEIAPDEFEVSEAPVIAAQKRCSRSQSTFIEYLTCPTRHTAKYIRPYTQT